MVDKFLPHHPIIHTTTRGAAPAPDIKTSDSEIIVPVLRRFFLEPVSVYNCRPPNHSCGEHGHGLGKSPAEAAPESETKVSHCGSLSVVFNMGGNNTNEDKLYVCVDCVYVYPARGCFVCLGRGSSFAFGYADACRSVCLSSAEVTLKTEH